MRKQTTKNNKIMSKVKKTAETVKAYKVFNKYLACRGFQYEIGKTYETEGDITEKGFYAWESPMAVFSGFYMFGSRFCEVELSGNILRDKAGDKRAYASKIKIVAELKFADIIRLGIEWLSNVPPSADLERVINDDYASVALCGYTSRVNSSGDCADIVSIADFTRIVSSGRIAKIGSSGDNIQIGSSGCSANIGSNGYSPQIGSSGKSVKITSSGDEARIVSSGDLATITCSRGNNACIGSNGHHALISTSGDFTKISSNGNFANINSNGFRTLIESSGKNSVICCTGHGGRVKAKKGSWITLAEWVVSTTDGSRDELPVCIKTEYVDGERIKEDTWYMLQNGEFVEWES